MRRSCGLGRCGGAPIKPSPAPATTSDAPNNRKIYNCSTKPYANNLRYANIGRTSTVDQRYVGRHNEGANFVFADGHSKWSKMENVAKRNKNGVMYLFTIEDDQNL